MITQFELGGHADVPQSLHWFVADFQLSRLPHPTQQMLSVDHAAFVTYRDMWTNWGWDELMKFIAYNIVDQWDTQDTYARYSLAQ